MTRCNPIDMRNALIMVEALKRAGIEFVAVPVLNSDHKAKLIAETDDVLNKLGKVASD